MAMVVQQQQQQHQSSGSSGGRSPNGNTSNNGGSSQNQGVDTTYTKIFVGGLAWETKRETMKKHFEQYGDIQEAVVIMDKNTGRSKGYGFVTFKEAEAAKKACADPTHVIDGRRANCNLTSLGAHRGSRPSPPPHRYMKESSSILVIGLSIHTAPVEMREKLAIPEAEWPWAIGELCNLNHIEEGAVLCTCNRMEIYVSALAWHRAIREVTVWMSKTSGINIGELCEHLFILRDNDAIQHLFQVSSGLDSLVLGEGQILSQTKQVYKAGQGVVGFGKNIGGLFKHAITAGMRVRADTSIAAGAVSVSSAAVELAIMKLSKDAISHANMLVIGAGKMGRLVIKHLIAKGCKRILHEEFPSYVRK